MGNYLSPGSSGQKRKQTETDSTEHDFNTDLVSGTVTSGSTNSSTSSDSQINENLEESSSRLTGILNRMNQPDMVVRSRGGLDPTRSLRSSDFDSLLFNRSRIARAT